MDHKKKTSPSAPDATEATAPAARPHHADDGGALAGGMDASRNNRGEAHENGAVESQNRHLKKAIEQALILRGSRDFACVEGYRRFVDMLVAPRNRQRATAVQAERAQSSPSCASLSKWQMHSSKLIAHGPQKRLDQSRYLPTGLS